MGGVSALLFLFALVVLAFFNFCAKCLCPTRYIEDWREVLQKSTKTIEKAVRRMLLVKLVFLVPMISLLIKVLLVVLAINSATLLASPSIKEFRVIGACPEELCINNSTNKFFAEGDLCVPEHFKECT